MLEKRGSEITEPDLDLDFEVLPLGAFCFEEAIVFQGGGVEKLSER